jgi:hypothetical protein
MSPPHQKINKNKDCGGFISQINQDTLGYYSVLEPTSFLSCTKRYNTQKKTINAT